MRFCMVTTFYGAHSFGGDAAYVERLSGALARRGHEVDIVHCADAFEAVAGDHPLRRFEPVEGVRVHTLRSGLGLVSPLWSHQTGRLGPKGRPLRELLAGGGFDVIHFHNVSLMGAPEVLGVTDPHGHALRLLTAHEFWLVCPMHALWKLDRDVCDRPQCLRCSLRGRRPLQLWRRGPRLERALAELDALICPSRHAAELHRARGIRRPIVHLPYFLPDDWAQRSEGPPAPRASRPYVAAAGRLVRQKGFEDLVGLMDRLPSVDLRLAGAGPLEPELRRLASERPNVELLGLLGPGQLVELFRGATAVVVPSLMYETFGYVVAEALAAGTPTIVRRRGALAELIDESGGGLAFEDDDEAVAAIRRVVDDPSLRDALVAAGTRSLRTTWAEETHVTAYLGLIERVRAEREATTSR